MVVRRPVGDSPASSLHFENAAVRVRAQGVDNVDVAVGAVAAGAAVGDAVAGVAPFDAAVLRALAVGEEGDAAVGEVLAVDLAEFVAALVFGEEEVAAGFGLVDGGGDGLGEEGELGAVAAGRADTVDLVGVAEAGGDEELALDGVPVDEAGAAGLGVAGDFVDEVARHGRQGVGYEARRRGEDRIVGGDCRCGESDGERER